MNRTDAGRPVAARDPALLIHDGEHLTRCFIRKALSGATEHELADELLRKLAVSWSGSAFMANPWVAVTAALARTDSEPEALPLPAHATASPHPTGLAAFSSDDAETIFSAARTEELEPGEPSAFREDLDSALARCGEVALSALCLQYAAEAVPSETASSFLQWLTLLPGTQSLSTRTRVLRFSLKSRDAAVRLAAATGLDWLNAVEHADAIRRAAESETSPTVRTVMLRIANRLAPTDR